MKPKAIQSTVKPTRICQNYNQWVKFIKKQVKNIKHDR